MVQSAGADHLHSDEGLFARWLGDGRPLLAACAAALVFAGGFAIFLALTGDFLPHDVDHLGMTADELCQIECRIVDFMVHDRASFGGALLGVGILYLWLVSFPLSDGESWAWWTLTISGMMGFATFLAYLGYGYLDSWHAIGTLALLPVFLLGLARSRHTAALSVPSVSEITALFRTGRNQLQVGRMVLAAGALGTFAGGAIIMLIGITQVFVPADLHFIGLGAAEVEAISPRLVPLIAHDRAGFGGAVMTMGLTTFLCLAFARPSRSLFEAIAVAGALSLTATFAIHFAVGYDDVWHLAPPLAAALSLSVGAAMAYPAVRGSGTEHHE